MNKFFVAKEVMKTVGAWGVGKVASNIIKATTPENITRIDKAVIWCGAFVISTAVNDVTSKYIEDKLVGLDVRFAIPEEDLEVVEEDE